MHMNTPPSSDGFFTEGLVGAHEHPENTTQMDTKAVGCAKEPE